MVSIEVGGGKTFPEFPADAQPVSGKRPIVFNIVLYSPAMYREPRLSRKSREDVYRM